MPFLPICYPPFNLHLTLTMGQALRWCPGDDEGWHHGVVRGKLFALRQTDYGVEYRSNVRAEIAEDLLRRYLGLDQPVKPIHDALLNGNTKMAQLVRKYRGMRILQQEPWECLITYVLSPRHKVPRIAKAVEEIATTYGDPLSIDRISRKSFPTAQRLVRAKLCSLRRLHLGVSRHAAFVHLLATEVVDGSLDLRAVGRMQYKAALERLRLCDGIQDKVANCILLFSMGKPEAFPLDTNIFTGLTKACRGQLDEAPDGWEQKKYAQLKDEERRQIRISAQAYFRPCAGYASQLLFAEYGRPKLDKCKCPV